MIETGGWQFDLEIHPPGWKFPAGKTWLAGWIWSPAGRLTGDVRGWIDDRGWSAIPGLPKPGLDERFLHRAGPPYLGFTLLVEAPAGAQLFRLEVRDESGAWTEIFRTAITVAPEAGARAPAPDFAELLPTTLADLLRRHAATPAHPWAALAGEAIAQARTEPLNSLPNPPFHGALEEPRAIGWVRYGRISVTGWLAHRHRRIVRLTAMVDPLLEVSLLHGLPRADVSDVFADLPGRESSAFLGHVDLPAGAQRDGLLKIFAELDDGTKHLVFAQRFLPRVVAGVDQPLPPLSRRTFLRASWELWQAGRRAGLRPPGFRSLILAVRTAWADYAAAAPLAHRPGSLPTTVPDTPMPARPLRVMVVTHNLNFEGAPWFIYELAAALARTHGISVQVVSPQEGPLRSTFAAAGLEPRIVAVGEALGTDAPEEFSRALERSTRDLPWATTDLVIGNTLVTFWAVLAARRAGKPALLYVHESSPVRRFFGQALAPGLWPVVEEAFHHATRVVYTAAATAAVHARLDRLGNAVLLPSWVDVTRVDEFAERADLPALRRKHDLDPEAVLLINVGSLCERKGQHVFIQAAHLLREELRHTYPDRAVHFVMVGARAGLYLDMLREEVARLGLSGIVRFVPETGEVFDFYALADVFVCTSFEESFPRVLLESAAFRRLIVTTNVNGIPEMLGEEDAWLTPPGDRHRLAEALKQALAAHFAGDRRRAENARATVVRKYHQEESLRQHIALARLAAGD